MHETQIELQRRTRVWRLEVSLYLCETPTSSLIYTLNPNAEADLDVEAQPKRLWLVYLPSYNYIEVCFRKLNSQANASKIQQRRTE
jgi:hypothetical protein